MEKIYAADSIDDTIESFVSIDGSIDTYYKKIWEPIENEHSLIQFLGLIERINGSKLSGFFTQSTLSCPKRRAF